MNTTTKYIFDQNIIDPIWYKEIGTKHLEVFKEDGKSKHLIESFKFNLDGKIISHTNPEQGWKAYPHSKDIKIVESERSDKIYLTDKYVYSVKGNLIKIVRYETQTNRILSTKNINYDNGQIVLISDRNKKIQFTRNKNGELLEIQTVTVGKEPIVPNMNFEVTLSSIFERNSEGKIVRKRFIYYLGENLIMSLNIEFTYGQNRQLISSKSEILNNEESIDLQTKFQYLNSTSDLLSKIENYQNDEIESSFEFQYDKENKIIRRIARRSFEDQKIVTLFERS